MDVCVVPCTYVCVWVYAPLHTYVCIRICNEHTGMCVCMYICVCMCVYGYMRRYAEKVRCVHMCVYVYATNICVYAYTCVCTYVCTCIHSVYAYTCVCTCVCTCIYICVHTYMCVHMCVYVCATKNKVRMCRTVGVRTVGVWNK